MFKDTMTIHTFGPGENAYGQNGGAYEGNLRKGELRGIIHINKDHCVGCDTCRKFCPTDAIKGGLGAKHEIIDDACLYCGQCLVACPFNAIEQMSFVDEVERVLDAKDRIVVAQPSPAVRVSICEEFGGEPGELSTEQMVNALEALGCVTYDCNSSADQTIIEEGTEFVKKVQYWVLGERGPEVDEQGKHPFPHFTSCCPGWVKYAETYAADMLPTFPPRNPSADGWHAREDVGSQAHSQVRSPQGLLCFDDALHGQDLRGFPSRNEYRLALAH